TRTHVTNSMFVVRAARNPKVDRGSQYAAPRRPISRSGMPMCSEHVQNAKPRRSAAVTTVATSSIVPVASHDGPSLVRVRIGVAMPSVGAILRAHLQQHAVVRAGADRRLRLPS